MRFEPHYYKLRKFIIRSSKVLPLGEDLGGVFEFALRMFGIPGQARNDGYCKRNFEC